VLNGAVVGSGEEDLVVALKQRLPEVAMSGREVRLLCDVMEAFVWAIHRWGRHEAYLEGQEREDGGGGRHYAVGGPLMTIESTGGGDRPRARRAG
jgi:hypothetical protein